jgi:hypothetical protein
VSATHEEEEAVRPLLFLSAKINDAINAPSKKASDGILIDARAEQARAAIDAAMKGTK